MWEFIKILLFSATFSISGGRMDFPPGSYQFDPAKPLVAINEGASVYVDVSSMLPAEHGLESVRKWGAEHFPKDSMSVRLVPSKASMESVQLTFQGKISYTSDSLYLILSGDKNIPEGAEYNSVEFATTIELDNSELIWKNYGK